MKEEDYVMMLMSTYGKNERVDKDKLGKIGGDRKTLKWPETVHHHYQHRGFVE